MMVWVVITIDDIYTIYDSPETIITDNGDEVLIEFDDTAILFENVQGA